MQLMRHFLVRVCITTLTMSTEDRDQEPAMEDTTKDEVSEVEDTPDNDSNQQTTNVKQSSNEEEDPVEVLKKFLSH